MMPCELGNTRVDSLIIPEMRPKMICPQDRKERNSAIGALKSFPNINPIQAIVTPIEIEIQKGPRLDLRYLCLISA